MPEQTLHELQEPGALRRMFAQLHRQRLPTSFAFQSHNPLVSYGGAMRSPPVLLLSSPGQPFCRSRLRPLRIPAPDAQPFRSGRPILGWVFPDGRRRIFATPQSVSVQTIRRGLSRLAALAGVSGVMRRVEVVTRAAGAAMLETHRASRVLGGPGHPVPFQVTVTGLPSLRLGARPPQPGVVSGVVSQKSYGVVVDLQAAEEPSFAARQALLRVARMCGLSRPGRILFRHSPPGSLPRPFSLPRQDTEAILAHAYSSISGGFSVVSTEQKMICSHGASATYGELLLEGVSRIFARVPPARAAFLDMGSGTGRAVLAAGCGFPVQRADGVELSPTRSRLAGKALGMLREKTGRPWPRIHLYEGDMLAFNIQPYNVIFVSNLCFDDSFNSLLANKFDRELRRRTHVFSSRSIQGRHSVSFPALDQVKMSWSNRSSLHHALWWP